MSQENIYQAPQSEIAQVGPGESILASRLTRLIAAMLDSLILVLVLIPVALAFGFFDGVMDGREPGLMFSILSAILGIAIFVALNGYLLANYGQTIGKKLFNIKIVDMNGELLSLGKLIGLRYTPFWLISSLPLTFNVLPLINAALIFRKDKRCGHDLIAGTQVVKL